jgi:uncharacterized protein
VISFFSSFGLSASQWVVFFVCGILIGMAKTGLSGLGIMVVPLMATIFGGKVSVGILLPILIIADFFAVFYFNRHANWKYVFRLLPWAVIGILAGAFFGHQINDRQFKSVLSIIIITGIALMFWQDLQRNKFLVPDGWWFAAILGFGGGFTTMVGNAAGPIMSLYLLSMRLPKNNYIGTGAWFFFIINLSKVPLHVFYWHTIDFSSVMLDLFVVPGIFLGAFSGRKIVNLFPEKVFRLFVLISTFVAAIFLL